MLFYINVAYESHATINHTRGHVCAKFHAQNNDVSNTIRANVFMKSEPDLNAQHFIGVQEAKHAKSNQYDFLASHPPINNNSKGQTTPNAHEGGLGTRPTSCEVVLKSHPAK